MNLETPLNQAPILCHRCRRPVATFSQWFSQTCSAEPAHGLDLGHRLDWPQIMLLQFQTAAQEAAHEAL